MNKRKWISLFLALSMTVSMCGVTSFAEDGQDLLAAQAETEEEGSEKQEEVLPAEEEPEKLPEDASLDSKSDPLEDAASTEEDADGPQGASVEQKDVDAGDPDPDWADISTATVQGIVYYHAETDGYTAKLEVTDKNNNELTPGVDYTCAINPQPDGTCNVEVTGKDPYTNKKECTGIDICLPGPRITIEEITTTSVEVELSPVAGADKYYLAIYKEEAAKEYASAVFDDAPCSHTFTKLDPDQKYTIVAYAQADGFKPDPYNTATVTTPVIWPSGIKIKGISKKIAAGKKIQLTAQVLPYNANDQDVTWQSKNKKVATVTEDGLVTMNKKAGGKSVVITATTENGVVASYKIKCMKHAVKGISITSKKRVKLGKSMKLKAVVKTTGKHANKKLKWSSSNPKIATVSSSGKIKTFKGVKGTVKITATATDESGKKKTITLRTQDYLDVVK